MHLPVCYLHNFLHSLHVSLSSTPLLSSQMYWDWSWDELAAYDLPAMVHFILQATGRPSLLFIGHSQARPCCRFFFMAGALLETTGRRLLDVQINQELLLF